MLSVEATARDRQHGSNPLLPSAEQCLAAMKTRIKIIHGVSKTLTGNLSKQLLISHALTCWIRLSIHQSLAQSTFGICLSILCLSKKSTRKEGEIGREPQAVKAPGQMLWIMAVALHNVNF